MRFTRIRIENWQNFAAIDVIVDTRVFIVGANASGKSNLLDALRFLHDLVVPGGGFQEAINKRGGVSRLRNLAARGSSTDVVIDVEIGETAATAWRYRIAFNNNAGKTPVVVQEKVWGADDIVLVDRPDEDDTQDPARLQQTVLEQTFVNKAYREIATFFATVDYAHIVPQLIRSADAGLHDNLEAYGVDLLEQIATKNKRTQDSRLRRIESVLSKAVPQFSGLKLTRDNRGVSHLESKYQHWRPQGAWQNEQDFSDGTLRLIGLLWALQEGNGPLLLEEPELSLHPSIVRQLPQMMVRVQRLRKLTYRQTFISTHSPDLLSDEGIGAHEVLLLDMSAEGTRVSVGAEIAAIRQTLDSGFSMADAVMPFTQPANVDQLSLFEDER